MFITFKDFNYLIGKNNGKGSTIHFMQDLFTESNQYKYYDFQLDSLSPARALADSTIAQQYPYDRLGIRRKSLPDAGCYEYAP